jgi:hypothetical protein
VLTVVRGQLFSRQISLVLRHASLHLEILLNALKCRNPTQQRRRRVDDQQVHAFSLKITSPAVFACEPRIFSPDVF